MATGVVKSIDGRRVKIEDDITGESMWYVVAGQSVCDNRREWAVIDTQIDYTTINDHLVTINNIIEV